MSAKGTLSNGLRVRVQIEEVYRAAGNCLLRRPAAFRDLLLYPGRINCDGQGLRPDLWVADEQVHDTVHLVGLALWERRRLEFTIRGVNSGS